MAQKQLEEKIEVNEKNMPSLKELLLGLCKNIEKLTDEVQESTLSRKMGESTTSEGSQLKMKGKMVEEAEFE